MVKSGGVSGVANANIMKTTVREDGLKAFTPCRRRAKTRKSSCSQSDRSLIEKKFSSKCTKGKHNLIDLEWTHKISGCPVFHPSNEEFEDPLKYLQKIAAEASKYGICKIVSPVKASFPAAEVLKDFKFPTYVQPLRVTEPDMDQKVIFSMGERNHTFNTFKSMADEEFVRRFPCSKYMSPEHLEKKFWLEISSGKEEIVEYAINVDGSAFSSDPDDPLGTSKWNFKTLPKLPNSILSFVEHEIPGITYPMLYIGMLFSMFAWHVEDHYLFSINYHHTGAPKTWYGVPGHAASQFEKVVHDHVYSHDILSIGDEHEIFKEISEKTTMFSPSILLQHGVPVYKAVQMPGEFVVTFPRAYHAGFSNGFNCGEAVNFAIGDWFPFGAMATKQYAHIGLMAILPYEELLCKEAARLWKHEALDCSSVELASHKSVKISFVQHVCLFNNALWNLNNNVENLSECSMLLPDSHGTIICGTCKRDCYLAFLECNHCYRLLCHFHDIKSLDCPCGGKLTLFIRENIWNTEDLAQRFEKEGSLEEVRSQKRCGDNVGLQPNVLISGIKNERVPHRQNLMEETPSIEVKGKDDAGDSNIVNSKKRGCLDLTGSLPFFSGCKRARTSCTLQKTQT